ncbi:MAG: HD-GYP domain-containing protein [Lachnospiraceae bacterium]
MFDFKLQLGCLILVVYIIMAYIKGSFDKKVSCNKIFDLILAMAPWAIIMDGVTAWTVNHMDIVPKSWNLVFHCLFFICMNSVSVLIFMYMISQTIGIRNKKRLVFTLLPGIVSFIIILMSISDLYYVEGKTTRYSMGVPVVACYASTFVHFIMIFALIIMKHRELEKQKMTNIVTFMLICICILIAQIICPEILISSLVPTITILGLYLNFEDPSLQRLKVYNSEMVTGFATLVENRDNSTGGHIKRTKGYVKILLKEMSFHEKYKDVLSRDYKENVINAAPMHDIGKISTPDYILQKPGKLTDEEYCIMKEHAAIGGDIINETFADLDEPDYQKITYEVARFHHEKWNGKGYPDKLSGEEIPLHARIMAIADVFDAVSAKRVYRDAMPIEKCFKIIEEGAGTDFDPYLVGLFLEAKDEILEYYNKEKDME